MSARVNWIRGLAEESATEDTRAVGSKSSAQGKNRGKGAIAASNLLSKITGLRVAIY